MPKLIRLYITQVAIGFAIAAAFVGMLLWFNVANLWHLVTHTEQGLLAVVILWIANGIVFAGVQFGISVMRMQDDDDEPRGGHRQHVMHHDYAAIPVRADDDRRRGFRPARR
ncbi:hypothetical protein [Roseovarius sp. D22-M7]|uniref:hypothetical protein n=1 Tax=Roseovarius sp. D22-M7 TaxID=3127116 RepID=UPI00300F83DF